MGIAGLGWSFLFFLISAITADLLLRHSVIGRNMYAVGGNARVAELVGIDTRRYKIGAFIAVGALSAIAGMFVMADLASATTGIGSGWELTVIAGVVVGGVSLFGGAGSVLGGLLGVLLLQAVQSGLVTVGVSANWQQIAVGLIMIAAVGLDTVRRRLAVSELHGEAQAKVDPGQARSISKGWVIGCVVLVLGVFGIRAHWRSTSETALAHAGTGPNKHLLWVQPLRDHPVCKLMQAGFLNRCQELGYACEVVGNASATTLDVAATIPLAQAALARERFAAVGVFTLDTSI